MTSHYIDNEKLTTELSEWKEKVVQLAKDKKCRISELDELPQVNNYIGKAILDIAKHYATKHNFSGYSYKDEMISDGVLQTLKMIKNFDGTKMMRNGQKASAFNYISLIIFQSFLRRIEKEKHQQQIKNKSLIEHSLEDLMDEVSNLSFDTNGTDQPTEYLQTIYNDHLQRYQEYEIKLNSKKKSVGAVKKHKGVKSLF